MRPKKIPGIPSQLKGGFHDTESMQEFENAEQTELQFNNLKNRFFDINKWHNCNKENTAVFTLCDSLGVIVNRMPQIGDYIKILLQNNNNPKITDYNWVQIDMIDKSNPDRLMIQFRPSKLPGNEFAGKTVHFYSAGSTSTFVISKGDNYIKMGVYGRNEKANHNTDFLNLIKNTFISLNGKFGSSKIKWKQLTDGLVYNN